MLRMVLIQGINVKVIEPSLLFLIQQHLKPYPLPNKATAPPEPFSNVFFPTYYTGRERDPLVLFLFAKLPAHSASRDFGTESLQALNLDTVRVRPLDLFRHETDFWSC